MSVTQLTLSQVKGLVFWRRKLIAGAKGEGKTEALSHADSSERMGENVT